MPKVRNLLRFRSLNFLNLRNKKKKQVDEHNSEDAHSNHDDQGYVSSSSTSSSNSLASDSSSQTPSTPSTSNASTPRTPTFDLTTYSSTTHVDAVDDPACAPASFSRCNAVIFDLGDVLFTWSARTRTSISPKLLRNILRSATWFEYEKGNLLEHEAYEAVGREFNLDPAEVARAFHEARDSLESNPALIALIRELKTQHNLRVFAMSNISAPDYEIIKTRVAPEDWALFDEVFTSAAAHDRKPNLSFYKHVLERTGVDPLRTAFVDDKLENVLPARSLGIRGIRFDTLENVARQLRNYCGDTVIRAQAYLRHNAKKMLSVLNTGVTVHENFAPLLIYEATGDRSLVEFVEHPRLFNFFIGDPVMTSEAFPFDLDTTSIGLTVTTHVDEQTKMSVMDEMLTCVNKDGIIQTYFDPTRPRTDPCVCVNVLTLFHMHGRGHELAATLDWVYSILTHRAYLDGTLYYYNGDAFLFFLSRLLSVSSSSSPASPSPSSASTVTPTTVTPTVRERFAPLFKRRCIERSGADGDALALAMRVIAGASVGVRMYVDYEQLVRMQEEDGSFPMAWAYKYGESGIVVGNKGLVTALAVQACKAFEALDRELV